MKPYESDVKLNRVTLSWTQGQADAVRRDAKEFFDARRARTAQVKEGAVATAATKKPKSR